MRAESQLTQNQTSNLLHLQFIVFIINEQVSDGLIKIKIIMKFSILASFIFISLNSFSQQKNVLILGTWKTTYKINEVDEKEQTYIFLKDGSGMFTLFSSSRKSDGIGCRIIAEFEWKIEKENELTITFVSNKCECNSYKSKSLKTIKELEQKYRKNFDTLTVKDTFIIKNNSILDFDNHKFLKQPFLSIDCITNNYIFPSIIFSEIHSKSFRSQIYFSFDYVEDVNGLKIEILENRFLNKKTYDLTEDNGGTYFPNLDWKYEELQKIKNPVPFTINLKIYFNGKIENINKTFTIRPLNECLLGYEYLGKYIETSKYIGGFVNEDSPEIKNFISQSFKLTNAKATGNQLNSHNSVKEQVFVLWHYMYTMGFKYSSLSNVSAKGENFNSQYIRSVFETLKEKSANCVDASVLFASALTRLGIQARILILPKHAIVGYVSYENGEPERNFIELTMLDGIKKVSPNSKETIIKSKRLFEQAIQNGNKQYPGDDIVDDSDEYQLYKIDIDFRKDILPIPFKLF